MLQAAQQSMSERSAAVGTDIWGYVEIKKAPPYDDGWEGIIALRGLVDRSYGMFGSLFGMRNDAGFVPIAPERGKPARISVEYGWLRDNVGPPSHETWVLWSELLAVDWEEEGDALVEDPAANTSTGKRWVRRRDYLRDSWKLLFEMMALLARDYGAEHVRLTVWFD